MAASIKDLKFKEFNFASAFDASPGVWLSDGTTLVTASGADVEFVSAYKEKPSKIFKGVCEDGVDKITITRDQSLIAVVCSDSKYVKIIDGNKGEEVYKFTLNDGEYSPKAVAFDPSGRFLAVGSISSVKIYQIADFKIVREIASGAINLIWLPEGKSLVASIYSQSQIYDFVNDTVTFEFPLLNSANFFTVSPDYKYVTFSTDKGVEVFDLAGENHDRIINVKTLKSVNAAIYMPDANSILAGDGSFIRAYDVKTGEAYGIFDAKTTTYNMNLSPKGDVIHMGGSFIWNNDKDTISEYISQVYRQYFTSQPTINAGLNKLNVLCNAGKLSSVLCLKTRSLIESNRISENPTLNNWINGKISDDVFIKTYR